MDTEGGAIPNGGLPETLHCCATSAPHRMSVLDECAFLMVAVSGRRSASGEP